MTKAIDIYEGQRFGRWTVYDETPVRKGKFSRRYYLCRCECGVSTEILASLLNTKKSTSCKSCSREIAYSRRSGDWGLEWQSDRIYKQYISGAHRRGIEWALTVNDVKEMIFKNCSYCDKEPSNLSKGSKGDFTKWRKDFYYNGIDRKNNAIGYTRENCVACCFSCNRAKMEMSSVEFVEMCMTVAMNNSIDLSKESQVDLEIEEKDCNPSYLEDYAIVSIDQDKGWLDVNS